MADGPTILVVDDDAGVREVTEAMLISGAYVVVTAGSAEEALSVLDSDAPVEAMVADVIMPGVDGYQLARRAKALRPALKILFISGYDSGPHKTDTGLKYGKVLWKPFRTDELLAEVAALLGRSQV